MHRLSGLDVIFFYTYILAVILRTSSSWRKHFSAMFPHVNNCHRFCYWALSMCTFSLILTSPGESESDLHVLQNRDSHVELLIYSSRSKEIINALIIKAKKCLLTGSHFLILDTKKHSNKGFFTGCYLPRAIFPIASKTWELPKSLNYMKGHQSVTGMNLSGEAIEPFCLMNKPLLLMTALYEKYE